MNSKALIKKEIIDRVIETGAKEIEKRDWLAPVRLLKTIAIIESDYGKNAYPRFEPAYWVGGKYWNDEYLPLLFNYGLNIAGSFGVFQILYFTARRYGFNGNPIELTFITISIPYVIRLINDLITNPVYGVNSIETFADAYNSGNARDKYIPEEYIKKFMEVYNNL